MDIKKIGVVGAGTMGTGIAQVAAVAGFDVVLNDVGDEFLERSLKIIDKSLSKLIEKGKITAPIKNLRFTHSYLEALNQVELIGGETSLHSAMIGVSRVPAIKVRSWNFSGATEF